MTTEDVLVVPVNALPALPQRGLLRLDVAELPRILAAAFFMSRELAEVDTMHKQVIPYCVLSRGETKRFLRYRRTSAGVETRLRGKYSIGVGGHVDRADALAVNLRDTVSLVRRARDRELHEELVVPNLGEPEYVGLLNDDSDPVGRVHLGLVFDYDTSSVQVALRDHRRHDEAEFVPVEVLRKQKDELEDWSQVLVEQYVKG